MRSAVPGGFTLDDFAIDTTQGTVTCPAGHIAPVGLPVRIVGRLEAGAALINLGPTRTNHTWHLSPATP